jgi:hypothetical protein
MGVSKALRKSPPILPATERKDAAAIRAPTMELLLIRRWQYAKSSTDKYFLK